MQQYEQTEINLEDKLIAWASQNDHRDLVWLLTDKVGIKEYLEKKTIKNKEQLIYWQKELDEAKAKKQDGIVQSQVNICQNEVNRLKHAIAFAELNLTKIFGVPRQVSRTEIIFP